MGKDIVEVMKGEKVLSLFADVLGDREARAYIQSVIIAVRSSDSLANCEVTSIIASALRAATLRLSVDPSVGHAYLVAYGKKATFLPGYKGYKHMALRTNKYRYINVGALYEGQTWEMNQLTGVGWIAGTRTGNKVIGRFAYFELLDGYSKSLYLTLEEIHAHALRYSPSYNVNGAPWKTQTVAMEMKTVLRLLLMHDGYFDPCDRLALTVIEEEAVPDDAEITEIAAAVETQNAQPEPPAAEVDEDQILHDLGF
jgi:recombination protein RecT